MGKEYRGLSRVGEYIDITGPSRVVLTRLKRGRGIELLIVTEGAVSWVEKPIQRPKECEE
jgi:hypothetical protein